MNGRFSWIPIKPDSTHTLGLLLCATFFVSGCMIGTIAAGFISSADQLSSTVRDYLKLASDNAAFQPVLMNAIIDACKYHLVAVFLGFSVLGVICIPALSAIRGFFLCFSVSVIIRLLGAKGILLALSVFGISTLMTIPCFFILSILSFSASQHLFRLAVTKSGKFAGLPTAGRTAAVCVVCFILLLVSALIETYLTPQLIQYAAAHITL